MKSEKINELLKVIFLCLILYFLASIAGIPFKIIFTNELFVRIMHSVVALMITYPFYAKYRDRDPLRENPVIKQGTRDYYLLTLSLLLAIHIPLFISPFLTYFIPEWPSTNETPALFYNRVTPSSLTSLALSLLNVAVLIPVLEEMLFRGIIFGALGHHWKPMGLIMISSLIFGISHLHTQVSVYAFFIGIFLGFIYHISRSILLCSIFHGLANSAAISYIYIGHNSKFPFDNSSVFSNFIITGNSALLLSTIMFLFVVGSVSLFMLMKNNLVLGYKEKFTRR